MTDYIPMQHVTLQRFEDELARHDYVRNENPKNKWVTWEYRDEAIGMTFNYIYFSYVSEIRYGLDEGSEMDILVESEDGDVVIPLKHLFEFSIE